MDQFTNFMHSLGDILNEHGYRQHDIHLIKQYFWCRLKEKYQLNWDECMFEIDLEQALIKNNPKFFEMLWHALSINEQTLWLCDGFADLEIAKILNSL